MASKLPDQLGLPAVIDSKIVEEMTGRFTFQAGIGDAVLSNERRKQISEIIFNGGWVKFVDQFDVDIRLFEIPNLSFLSCDTFEIQEFSPFIDCTDLKRVILPNLTHIKAEMFRDCHSLTRVDLPSATRIYNKAFRNCSQLETIDLPEMTEISDGAFVGCRKLSNINMPKLRVLNEMVFMGCIRLTSVKLHLVERIGESAFRDCLNLQRIDLPEALIIDTRAFSRCKSLTDIRIPKVTTITYGSFRQCENLRRIELPSIRTLEATSFLRSPTKVFVTQWALDNVEGIRQKLRGKVRLLGTERPRQRRRTQLRFKNLRL